MKKLVVLASIALPALFAVTAMGAETINAAGATFPAPIYQKWFGEYKMAHPDVQINYQAIGSGGGIRQLTEGTVDFGASDMPLTDEQIKAVKVKPLHFPTVLGAVVLSYNIPGFSGTLKLTPEAIAGIYLGEIKKWNDPKLTSANPGAKLPASDIQVVHRSDGSGTSFIFTDYLSKVSSEWKMKVGANTSVSWPLGLGGKGNDGVEGLVKQTPGSIGYVELIYAVQNKMAFADVKNAAGKFMTPSFQSVSEAAAASKEMPADFRASITDAPGVKTYPISSFTWLLIPSEIKDPARKKAITGFLSWMMTTGQKDCEALSYAQLPKAVVAREQKQIALIK
ncbi:MAG TPA: phosphate ABC transporter substrate-binding protein PstS [Bryobacteraceae bacterium]|jgi:phosphate transport system substrate-binding protein|nr:phosphate ABC transporter substrate-binding protein PstS [Bryobacteraceae bacterium]